LAVKIRETRESKLENREAVTRIFQNLQYKMAFSVDSYISHLLHAINDKDKEIAHLSAQIQKFSSNGSSSSASVTLSQPDELPTIANDDSIMDNLLGENFDEAKRFEAEKKQWSSIFANQYNTY
jgi:tRNA U55 pseudouridine synthase TruB